LSATLFWLKQAATLGFGDYRHRGEPILYGWLGDGHRRVKDRTQTTVLEIDREANLLHLTQKPISLLSRILRNSTIRGEVVLDLFAGSGSTLIACEQLGRRCFAMELDARYCDVVVQRWETYTGQKARLVRPDTEPVKEVAASHGQD
jgi:site-specific DNA-methyltransferase (adenine-specific)